MGIPWAFKLYNFAIAKKSVPKAATSWFIEVITRSFVR
jgi:hypothetical protein